jgi:ABC-type multidrug transport system fused ATPase/permease subunit
MFTVTSERQISRIRREFMSSLLRQDMAWFDKNKTGEINSRLAECVTASVFPSFPSDNLPPVFLRDSQLMAEGMGEKLGQTVSSSSPILLLLGTLVMELPLVSRRSTH